MLCGCGLAGTRACDNCSNGPGSLAPPCYRPYGETYRSDPIDYDKLAKKLAELINRPKEEQK